MNSVPFLGAYLGFIGFTLRVQVLPAHSTTKFAFTVQAGSHLF